MEKWKKFNLKKLVQVKNLNICINLDKVYKKCKYRILLIKKKNCIKIRIFINKFEIKYLNL